MTAKLGPRCTAEYLPDARPLLAADATARVARQPVPVRDWRCVREPHGAPTEHLAMPAGVTGMSCRFSGVLVKPDTCPTCTAGTGPDTYPAAGRVCPDCYTPARPDAGLAAAATTAGLAAAAAPAPGEAGLAAAAPQHADPDDVRRLIDLVQQPGTTAIHVNDGDELLLLLPEADDKAVERSAQALADLFPTVSFLVLAGVTGAVVMPRRPEPTYDELIRHRDNLIMQGVDPEQLAMPTRRLDDPSQA